MSMATISCTCNKILDTYTNHKRAAGVTYPLEAPPYTSFDEEDGGEGPPPSLTQIFYFLNMLEIVC